MYLNLQALSHLIKRVQFLQPSRSIKKQTHSQIWDYSGLQSQIPKTANNGSRTARTEKSSTCARKRLRAVAQLADPSPTRRPLLGPTPLVTASLQMHLNYYQNDIPTTQSCHS